MAVNRSGTAFLPQLERVVRRRVQQPTAIRTSANRSGVAYLPQSGRVAGKASARSGITQSFSLLQSGKVTRLKVVTLLLDDCNDTLFARDILPLEISVVRGCTAIADWR
jgi:hypothetical protein